MSDEQYIIDNYYRGSRALATRMAFRRRMELGQFATAPLADAIILALFANGEGGAVYCPYDLTDEKLAWRRNLLLWSEDLIGNGWQLNHADMGISLDTETGFYEVEDFGVVSDAFLYRNLSIPDSTASYTLSLDILKAETSTAFCAVFLPILGGNNIINSILKIDQVTGVTVAHGGIASHTVEDKGNYWKVIVTVQNNGTGNTTMHCRFYPAYNTDISSISRSPAAVGKASIRKLQLENGSVATDYQKITDFNTDFMAAFPNHTLFQNSTGTIPVTGHLQPVGLVLDKSGRNNHASQPLSAARPLWQNNGGLKSFWFDGFDDRLVSVNNVNMSVSDEVSVFVGQRKTGETQATLIELGAATEAVNGSFRLIAPLNSTTPYSFASRGTTYRRTAGDANAPSPDSNVITGYSKISAPKLTLLVTNGYSENVTSSQGSGSFRDDLLHIGSRAGDSAFFQGHIYGLVIRSTLTPEAQAEPIQQLLATRSGVTL